LFSPFDRLGAETSGIEGTGLGLTLSHQLAQAMGGLLGCSSTVGQGSTFFVELAETQPHPQVPVASEPSEVSSELPREKRFAVLYVENNLDNISLVEEVLAFRPRIQLLTARGGEEGLEMARRHLPELIFLDVHLPDMKGDGFLLRLRSIPKLADVPVIALSADATMNQITQLRAAGVRDYLTKPFDVALFLKALDHAMMERTVSDAD
jgi:CheY-like chemotaxis protein